METGERSQIYIDKNQNEENEIQYSQRLLNITKSRCDTSVHPERALAEYAYDEFYNTGEKKEDTYIYIYIYM
jgi:hypothetical protein